MQVNLYKNASCNRELSIPAELNVLLVIDREKFPKLIGLALPKYALAIPLQAWTGSEGSRRLRLPGFKTIGT